MTARVFACALAAAGMLTEGELSASDRVGIYSLVDKVVVEPDAEGPAAVQIWGAFVVALPDQPKGARRYEYQPVRRGSLYFVAPPRGEELARREWADLARIGGTGEIVAFGSGTMIQAGAMTARVRPASERPSS